MFVGDGVCMKNTRRRASDESKGVAKRQSNAWDQASFSGNAGQARLRRSSPWLPCLWRVCLVKAALVGYAKQGKKESSARAVQGRREATTDFRERRESNAIVKSGVYFLLLLLLLLQIH